jgi:zinc protease
MPRARLALLCTLLIFPAPARAQADLPIRDTTLANGLQVIVIENHAVPLVTVELDVKNGGYTQTPEYEGLAHLYEHMFFKANRTIPSQERYLQRLRQLGASWNGTTSEERVNYFVTVGTDSVRPAMQFMEDAVRFPLFQQDELVRERPVVIGEFDRNEANPYFHLFRGIDTLLWTPDYYSRKNVIGNRAIILGTTQEKMREIQRRYYVPNNTALILAGDISPSQGFRTANEVFGDWPRAANPFATPIPEPPRITKSQAVIVTQPVNAAAVAIRWQGPSVTMDPASTYAADVLSAILNKRTSRFTKRLVDSSLAFDANINYYTLSHVGPITIFLQTSPEKAVDAERAALEEVARFADSSYVSPRELSDAQKELGIQSLYEREQSSTFAHTVGFWWTVAGLDYYRTYVPNMQRVTRGDLARYAQTYLVGKPYVVAVLLSPDAKQTTGLRPEALLPKELVP